MAASICFTDRNIRWTIQSFVNDNEQQKQKLNVALKELVAKVFFDNDVLPRLKKGNRKVVFDGEYNFACANCYTYGQDYDFVHGRPIRDGKHYTCGNHDIEAEPTYWMSFEEFKNASYVSVPDTYEEFEEQEKRRIQEELEFYKSYAADWN